MQPDLFASPAHRISDASLEAYQRIAATLPQKEIAVFRALHSYIREYYVFEMIGGIETRVYFEDVTGGELAVWMGWPTTSTRPRLTALCGRGWIEKGPIRASRLWRELRAHGYKPVVPLAAVERIAE